MIPARIYNEEWTVDARLSETFGVTRGQLIQVVKEVVGARADAVENDPITAAGQFAYIHGTRNVRALFRSRGWNLYRKDNIELVRHPERDLTISYQSVDLAASESYSPMAISGKGAGAERAIEEAQLSLFSPAELERHDPRALATINTGMWFFCVSVVGEDVRAELSLASGVSGGNFSGFIERIFIVKKGDWDNIRLATGPDSDAVDFEPIIIRKQ
ncbi:MAG: hypothetical protein H2054_03465 [Sphingomonas sp.]|uniref:hypothetical protein n=1 Tax=Sphingomonas sp. TaxID=28214 RepID=UPI0011DA4A85|nr:hypothetical protein [Sphingomonas sp.]TXG97931.1 MAG: hypothetical protein E6R08_05955 [Nevskiaceae bacterium]